MKMEQSSARSRRISLQLSLEEFDKLQGKLLCSRHSNLSEYLRDLISNGTLGIACRNKSIDEFLGVTIGLKNELNAIGQNLNQAVRRLHETHHLSSWKDDIEYYQANQFAVVQKTEEIRQILIKICSILQE